MWEKFSDWAQQLLMLIFYEALLISGVENYAQTNLQIQKKSNLNWKKWVIGWLKCENNEKSQNYSMDQVRRDHCGSFGSNCLLKHGHHRAHCSGLHPEGSWISPVKMNI